MFALIARTQQTTMLDGYIEYGAGDFDGQSSGHDYMGVSAQAQNDGNAPGPLLPKTGVRKEHTGDANRQSLGKYRLARTGQEGWPCHCRVASGVCCWVEPCAGPVGT